MLIKPGEAKYSRDLALRFFGLSGGRYFSFWTVLKMMAGTFLAFKEMVVIN
jgi:hypothetical protein